MLRFFIVAVSLFVTSANAQQPDALTLQRAITILQQQRNQALDALVNAEVEIQRLKAEIEELKKKIPTESKD